MRGCWMMQDAWVFASTKEENVKPQTRRSTDEMVKMCVKQIVNQIESDNIDVLKEWWREANSTGGGQEDEIIGVEMKGFYYASTQSPTFQDELLPHIQINTRTTDRSNLTWTPATYLYSRLLCPSIHPRIIRRTKKNKKKGAMGLIHLICRMSGLLFGTEPAVISKHCTHFLAEKQDDGVNGDLGLRQLCTF
ncbi:hypothetical protein C5167_048649 [Papaver somniferum]|uniref:Uncharacterized protein n=1 Tax=Papaver somniferum TaxID=3469 RepID=A0A4Y7KLF6_PAPSO|nr:hypothetical protein C5167_048649 [Papaver somniferum]